jgi:hypothetical protein
MSFAPLPVAPRGALPTVCGIITVQKSTQLKLARKAAESFQAQTYPKKQLFLVSPTPVDGFPEGVEVLVSPPDEHRRLYVEARNKTPNESAVCWWPYDSYSPPLRLDRQMTAFRAGLTVSVDAVLLYDVLSNNACVVGSQSGFAWTSLTPRLCAVQNADGPDVVPFPMTDYQSIVLSGGLPRYLPPIRFRDQESRYPAEWFLPPGSPAGARDVWAIGDDLKTYLRSVLKSYGLKTELVAAPTRSGLSNRTGPGPR